MIYLVYMRDLATIGGSTPIVVAVTMSEEDAREYCDMHHDQISNAMFEWSSMRVENDADDKLRRQVADLQLAREVLVERVKLAESPSLAVIADEDIKRDVAEMLAADSSLAAQLLACRAIHKSKNQQISDLIRQIRELAVRADRAVEWIRWEDRQPKKGEAGWVIFRDENNGRVFMQAGTNVEGEWWHYQPLAWQPKPAMPFWAEA